MCECAFVATTEQDAIEAFCKRFPGLGASYHNGALVLDTAKCDHCEKFFAYPRSPAVRQEIHDTTGVTLFIEPHWEEKDEENHVFCCDECKVAYQKEWQIDTERCDSCLEHFPRDHFGDVYGTYYDSPFDESGDDKQFCSEDCQQSYEESTFYCDSCNRYIERSNGHLSHIRDYYGELICLRCYEEIILEEGVSREDFEKQRLSGMFFNHGNPEPISVGWFEVSGMDYEFVSENSPSLKRYCQVAMELIDAGFKVLNAYEHLSIMGGEGYVTLMAKRPDKELQPGDTVNFFRVCPTRFDLNELSGLVGETGEIVDFGPELDHTYKVRFGAREEVLYEDELIRDTPA